RRPGRGAAAARPARGPGPARLRYAAVHRHPSRLHPDPGRWGDQRPAGDADRGAVAVGPAPALAAESDRRTRTAPQRPAALLPADPAGADAARAGGPAAPGHPPAPARGDAAHRAAAGPARVPAVAAAPADQLPRSEEHTSELQ